MRLFLIFVLSGGIFGCEGDFRFTVVNNSNKPIYYLAGYSYPDTSIHGDSPIRKAGILKCMAGRSNRYERIGTWDAVFRELPTDTLMLFVFDADTVEILPWDKIRTDYKIVKRYYLTKHDLISRNWVVTYP